jgi:esterase/lipase superfamily enzyme
MRTIELTALVAGALLAGGCATHGPRVVTLMETPALYYDAALDPFAHVDASHRTTTMSVFYATNRKRSPPAARDAIPYGNGIGPMLSLGEATVRFGDENFSWESLYAASTAPVRDVPVPLTLLETWQNATIPIGDVVPDAAGLAPEQRAWLEAVNAQLAKAQDPEIMVYVHGTKVDFLNSVAMTAELDHFAGRDFVGIAFSWPSHQNILYYLDRQDVRRARNSSHGLQTLLELLAEHTTATRINVLCYSAGARVTSKGLDEMRQAYAYLDTEALRQRFRIGDVVFAAADVPLDIFLERLPAVTEMARDVAVTVSDHDTALEAAQRFMGHGLRAGMQAAEAEEEALVRSLGITNFHVVDVSLGQQGRGFDIEGHHYWYRHPWASSDIVLLMRTDLPAPNRGLSRSRFDGVYYLPDQYPDAVREAARRTLGDSWKRRPPAEGLGMPAPPAPARAD